MSRRQVFLLVLSLWLVSFGGLLLHTRIHPPALAAANWVPVIVGAISVVVVPMLFMFRRTLAIAYLLNFTSVVVGGVMMVLFSVEHWEGQVTWKGVLLETTLADILVLLAKLSIAHAILRLYHPARQS